MLAQATMRTNPAALRSTSRIGRTGPTILSSSVTTFVRAAGWYCGSTAANRPCDDIEIRPGLLERDGRPQPADEIEAMAVPAFGLRRRRPQRQEQLGQPTQRELEVPWQHADDRRRLTAESNRAANDERISAEPAAPRAVGDDDDGWAFGAHVGRVEIAAERRTHAQQPKEPVGHFDHRHAIRIAGARDDAAAAGERRGIDKRRVLRAIVAKVQVGHIAAARTTRVDFSHVNQGVGRGVRQRLEQHDAREREDGRRGRDAERERAR